MSSFSLRRSRNARPGTASSTTPAPEMLTPAGVTNAKRKSLRAKYYALADGVSVTNRWLVAGLAVSMCVNAIQATSIRFMLPLEKIVPYFLVASPTIPGLVQPANIVAKAFTPDQLQKRAAIEDWVNELWIIDPARTRQNLDHAATLTAGSAVQEMRAFIKQERMFGRMEESPNLRRDPTVLSTDFIADDIAIVRLALTERENGIPKPPTYKSMTIHFVTSTPKSYQEVRRSMIGLTIGDFTWSDARGMETLQ
ncbi:VirB8/TrbF family protein [Burkholderia gladioli]|uniref:VirB8/TrbF family protein n=1 Tax=Burkholderia gladioli TaxID=28095 RepID=UPI003F79AACF